jgi:VWFA-related protein
MSAAKPASVVTSALVMSLATWTHALQTPPDRVSVEVRVTRGGQAVAGLAADDFALRDSGVSQKVELAAIEGLPLNLVLVLDTSASLRGAALEPLKDAARAAFATLGPVDQGALVTFSQTVNLRAGWTGDRAVLAQAIDGITAQGSTSLTDAAFAALTMRGRPTSRTLVLFFTDGDDTASWLSAADVARAARRAEAVVSSVMLTAPGNTAAVIAKAFAAPGTPGADARAQIAPWLADEPGLYRSALLPVLALETGGETVQLAEMAGLAAAFADILARHRSRYVLRYVPTGVAATGWHPIQVDVRGGGEVTTRSGYLR